MRMLALVSVLALVGCGQNENRPSFDGKTYRAKLSKIDKMTGEFGVTVSPVSQSLTGAREAGRYEATKYCIARYGTSDVAWMSGPDAEDRGLTIANDELELRGTCAP